MFGSQVGKMLSLGVLRFVEKSEDSNGRVSVLGRK